MSHVPVDWSNMIRTTSDWLDEAGIPPIIIVVVVIVVSVQLIVIVLLLVRCVIKKLYQSPYDDYEKMGADQFLVDRMETSTKKKTRTGGKSSFDSRRCSSDPTLATTSEVLRKTPTPSLIRHTPQPGARSHSKKHRISPSVRRGVSMKEETLAAKRRMLYAGTKYQSAPQDLFRASMESPEQQGHGSVIGRGSTTQAAAVVPTSRFGKISFAVTYDRQLEQIKIFLEQARQLAVKTPKEVADTFVKVSITPEQGLSPSTSCMVRNTSNPVYRQHFLFRVAPEAMGDLVVKFEVFELSEFSRKDPIGELEYPLSQHPDLEIPVMIWRDLQAPSRVRTFNKGELLFSLTYLPNAEKLTVAVLKARDLRMPEWGRPTIGRNALDTFVKVSLVKAGKVTKVKQTRLRRKSCNPVYNEGFSLKLRQIDLDEASVTLAVCLRLNHLGFHRVLGRCSVGRHGGADGASHWRDMINTPRSGVGQWHAIV